MKEVVRRAALAAIVGVVGTFVVGIYASWAMSLATSSSISWGPTIGFCMLFAPIVSLGLMMALFDLESDA
jgi:hypothetical protein